MTRRFVFALSLFALLFAGVFLSPNEAAAEMYVVKASGGPGPGSPAEAVELLENLIIPTFEQIVAWEKEGKVVGAGLPVGVRAIMMVVNAESNQEVDRMLRGLPAWGVLEWKVVALESVSGRMEMERQMVEELKKMME